MANICYANFQLIQHENGLVKHFHQSKRPLQLIHKLIFLLLIQYNKNVLKYYYVPGTFPTLWIQT